MSTETTTTTTTGDTSNQNVTVQTIPASSVSLLLEYVGIILESNIQKYASMKTEDLPTVRIGKVNGKTFAIDHYEVVLGCKQSKKNVRCVTEEFEKISDVMIQHFANVISNDILNTPRIYNLVDSLQEKLDTGKEDVLKILRIDKMQYHRLMTSNCNISKSSITRLEELVSEISKRKGLTALQASVPVYVLEKISRISDEQQQMTLIQFIQSDIQKKSDSRFFWMTPEQIDSVTQMTRQDATRTEHKREESTVAEFVEMDEIGKKRKEKRETTSSPSLQNGNTSKENTTDENPKRQNDVQEIQTKKSKPTGKTKQILDTMPNMIIIPDEKGRPEYLVDKKTSAVSKIDPHSHKEIIKTEQVPSKRLYSIPLDVTKFLGIGDSQSKDTEKTIRHKNITGIEGLQSFVKSQEDKTQRYTIFWNSE